MGADGERLEMGGWAIEIRMDGVTQWFPPDQWVLDEISLHASEGQPILIRGEAGCGKTLLLKVLCGKWLPNEGSVTVDGQDWRTMSELKRGRLCRKLFGIVSPGRGFIDALTLEENLLLLLDFAGGGRMAGKRRVREQAEKLGISALLGRYPEQLLPGELCLAQIFRALLFSPRFLLVDGLAPELSGEECREVWKRLAALEQQGDVTCIRTAGLREACRPGETCFLLRNGRLHPQNVLSLEAGTGNGRLAGEKRAFQ